MSDVLQHRCDQTGTNLVQLYSELSSQYEILQMQEGIYYHFIHRMHVKISKSGHYDLCNLKSMLTLCRREGETPYL
jgi:hypothetical protein